MKLFTKYYRINLPVMMVIFLLSAGLNYLLIDQVLVREVDISLAGAEKGIRTYYAAHHQFPQQYPLDDSRLSYELTDKPMATSLYSPITLYSNLESKMHNFRKVVFTISDNGKIYKVSFSRPLQGIHHLSRAIIFVSLLTVLTTLLAYFITNRMLLRRLWRPFYDSLHAMRNLQLGNAGNLHFPVTSTEEFAYMNESLGMAARKAGEDYLLLKEFTENASHELQTPLSAIRSKLEILIQDEDLSSKQSEIVSSLFASLKKLSRLNQSLLLLTKISNQQFHQLEQIDLREKMEDKLVQFRELWSANRIAASWQLEEASIEASPDLIDILLNNILSNAGNHNITNGLIHILLEPNKLTVSNTSPSPALDPKRVFTRFYKGELNTGNNGL
ncbi:MAG TPA: HAMP domain-containing sensor histidine kinase, partial [Puia sp.]|nr:HAMP domain-containing sensor histidine kinase [Puia sp.]